MPWSLPCMETNHHNDGTIVTNHLWSVCSKDMSKTHHSLLEHEKESFHWASNWHPTTEDFSSKSAETLQERLAVQPIPQAPGDTVASTPFPNDIEHSEKETLKVNQSESNSRSTIFCQVLSISVWNLRMCTTYTSVLELCFLTNDTDF